MVNRTVGLQSNTYKTYTYTHYTSTFPGSTSLYEKYQNINDKFKEFLIRGTCNVIVL